MLDLKAKPRGAQVPYSLRAAYKIRKEKGESQRTAGKREEGGGLRGRLVDKWEIGERTEEIGTRSIIADKREIAEERAEERRPVTRRTAEEGRDRQRGINVKFMRN